MYICSVRLCATVSSLCGYSKVQLYVSSLYITNPLVTAFCVFLWHCRVFPCGSLRLFCFYCVRRLGIMVCVGVEGEWCDLSEGAGLFSFSGYGMGVFYGWWGFSRVSKIIVDLVVEYNTYCNIIVVLIDYLTAISYGIAYCS